MSDEKKADTFDANDYLATTATKVITPLKDKYPKTGDIKDANEDGSICDALSNGFKAEYSNLTREQLIEVAAEASHKLVHKVLQDSIRNQQAKAALGKLFASMVSGEVGGD
jgi:hypothetical protein